MDKIKGIKQGFLQCLEAYQNWHYLIKCQDMPIDNDSKHISVQLFLSAIKFEIKTKEFWKSLSLIDKTEKTHYQKRIAQWSEAMQLPNIMIVSDPVDF